MTTITTPLANNGIALEHMGAVREHIAEVPELGAFEFRARSQWAGGAQTFHAGEDLDEGTERRGALHRPFVGLPDLDVRGMLGIDREVRNGPSQIRVGFTVDGDASPEELRKVVERSVQRSAVFDALTNGLDVVVDVA